MNLIIRSIENYLASGMTTHLKPMNRQVAHKPPLYLCESELRPEKQNATFKTTGRSGELNREKTSSLQLLMVHKLIRIN